MTKEIIKTEIKVKDNLIGIMRVGNVDYISLTDLAKFKNDKNPANVIIHCLSNKDTALYMDYGKNWTMKILISRNIVKLKLMKLVHLHIQWVLNNGFKEQMQ